MKSPSGICTKLTPWRTRLHRTNISGWIQPGQESAKSVSAREVAGEPGQPTIIASNWPAYRRMASYEPRANRSFRPPHDHSRGIRTKPERPSPSSSDGSASGVRSVYGAPAAAVS